MFKMMTIFIKIHFKILLRKHEGQNSSSLHLSDTRNVNSRLRVFS